MKHFDSPFSLPPRWRWLTALVFIFGGGAIAVIAWLEEAILAVCASLAAVVGMGGLVYGFYHFVFKATTPRREDLSAHAAHRDSAKGHRS